MTRELEKFVKVYLNLEQAYDTSGCLRPTLHAHKEDYVNAVRHGLETVLRTRELSVGDYERLAGIEFGDEEGLYGYLQGVHQYLFEGQEKQPTPPD
jgi:hypothetical protein